MFKCKNCGHEQEKFFKFCAACGSAYQEEPPINQPTPAEKSEPVAQPMPGEQTTAVRQVPTAQFAAGEQTTAVRHVASPMPKPMPPQPTPIQKKKKGMPIGCVIGPLVAIVLVLALVLGSVFIGSGVFNFPKKLNKNDMEKQSLLIDYGVIIEAIKASGMDVTAYIFDGDADGTDELFINTEYTIVPEGTKKFDHYRLAYVFDPDYVYNGSGQTAEKCHVVGSSSPYKSIGKLGADVTDERVGTAEIKLSEKYGVVLERGESQRNGGEEKIAYYKWTNGGWEYLMSNDDKVKDLGLSPFNNSDYNYGSVYFKARNNREFYEYYTDRNNDVDGGYSAYCDELIGDYDGDGRTEYVHVYNGFLNEWIAEATFETVGSEHAFRTCKSEDFSAVVYFDFGDTESLIHILSLDGKVANYDAVSVDLENGLMRIGYYADETAEHSAGYNENYFAIAEADEYREFYDYNDDEEYAIVSKLRNAYLNALYYQGNTDVRYRMRNLSSAKGTEMICVTNNPNEMEYGFEINVFYKGRVVKIFDGNRYNLPVNGYYTCFQSFYVYPTGNDVVNLLCYAQDYYNYNIRYAYGLLSFDEKYNPIMNGVEAVSVDLNSDGESTNNNGQGTTAEDMFFDSFNECLKTSIICVDPYELTGYAMMNTEAAITPIDIFSEGSISYGNEKYLSISNCNTSKSGVVKVSSAWLNLRQGPSTDYSRVYINPNDKKSYIKQYKGSTVTVLDTVNTGDSKNPIWVLIQTNYGGMVFQGYSSQKYITLDVKHISVGQSFDIDADTNDWGLSWTVNDKSVATIDAASGVITGEKAGLVMVTVTSKSGLTDTCLIMVDK